MSDSYDVTPTTRGNRLSDRITYDRATAHAILDEGFVGHLGFVVDGRPVVLPHVYARLGETVYVHASSGARAMTSARDGLAVCLSVTLTDGIVFARSAFNHSVNYRSVVIHGTATPVLDAEDKRRALDAVVNASARGRAVECRPPSAKELAATTVLALPLREVSVKVRNGTSNDDPEDLDLPYWAGVLPLTTQPGTPRPDSTRPVPDNVLSWSSRR